MEDFEQDLQKIDKLQDKMDENIQDIKWTLIDIKKEIRKNKIVIETIDQKFEREKNRRERKERAEERAREFRVGMLEALFWGAMVGFALIALFGILA